MSIAPFVLQLGVGAVHGAVCRVDAVSMRGILGARRPRYLGG